MRKLLLLSLLVSNLSFAQWEQMYHINQLNCIESFEGTIYTGNASWVHGSYDYGVSWPLMSLQGFTWPYIWDLKIDTTNNNVFAATGSGFYISTDLGANWTQYNNGLVLDTAVHSVDFDGSNIVLGTYIGGAYLSTNYGSSWNQINSGLTASNLNCVKFTTYGLFAGSLGGGIFKSTDMGATWTDVNTGVMNGDITSVFEYNSNIYAGTDGGGVMISIDGGNTWSQSNTGMFNQNVNAVAAKDGVIYAGTDGGMFYSIDDGASWTSWNNGLTASVIVDISLGLNKIYISIDDVSPGAGAWQRNYIDVANINEIAPASKLLLRIVDLIGRETEDKPNTTLIYIYSDGTTEKVYRME